VVRLVLALVVLCSVAHAEMIVVAPPPKPSLLGTRINYGLLPVGDWMTTASLSVSYDRSFAGKWHFVAEYEYLWLGKTDWNDHMEVESGVASLDDSGQRLSLGLRRRLWTESWGGSFRVLFDADAGVGAMLVDKENDAIALPVGYAGVHGAFELESDSDEHIWQYEIVLRGIGVPDGVGVLFGIGLAWGD
jgi:hypothetical protein